MNQNDELEEQYRDSSNLNARSRLHSFFGTNKYGWLRWVFDQFDLPKDAVILELGCGDGGLWAGNRSRVPPGWKITLSDFSPGMLDAAKRSLAGFQPGPCFQVIDAKEIGQEPNQFDAVVANHMLYHVGDLDAALQGIRRVLKIGGVLYATTNGLAHMKELREIVSPLAQGLPFIRQENAHAFGLENGQALLRTCFTDIELRRYEDSLEVTEIEPLMAWILSIRGARDVLDAAKIRRLRATLEEHMMPAGAVHITKSAGMLIGRKA